MSYTGASTPLRRPRAQPQGLGYVSAAATRRPGAIAARDAVRPIDDRMTRLTSYRRDLELAQMTRGVTSGERRRMASGRLRATADSSKPQIMTALGLISAEAGGQAGGSGGNMSKLPGQFGKLATNITGGRAAGTTTAPVPAGGGRVTDNRGTTATPAAPDSIPRPTSVPPPMLPAIFMPLTPTPRAPTPAPLPPNPPPVVAAPPDPVAAAPVAAPPMFSSGGGGGAAPAPVQTPTGQPITVSTDRVPEIDITAEATSKPAGFAISPTMLAVGAAATVGLILLLRRS